MGGGGVYGRCMGGGSGRGRGRDSGSGSGRGVKWKWKWEEDSRVQYFRTDLQYVRLSVGLSRKQLSATGLEGDWWGLMGIGATGATLATCGGTGRGSSFLFFPFFLNPSAEAMRSDEKKANQRRTIGATERLGFPPLPSLASLPRDGGGSSLHRRPAWRYAVKDPDSCLLHRAVSHCKLSGPR